MKIAVDVDNVLNDLTEKSIELYNARYDTKLTIDDFLDYSISKCLPYDDAQKFINLFEERSLWESLMPIKGSQKAIKKLIDKGHDIYFTTATNPVNFPWKVKWLRRFFEDIPESKIICIQPKGLLKVDILIDDCVDNLLASLYYDRICMDYPWNRNICDEVYYIYRCKNWEEIINAVEKINKEVNDV